MSSIDPFRRAEDEYLRLKGRLAAGRIAREQLEAVLKQLMLQDAQGRFWMLGADSGKWYVNDGQSWVEAQPPAAGTGTPAAPPAAQAQPRAPAAGVSAPPPAAKPPSRTRKVLTIAAAAVVSVCLFCCLIAVLSSYLSGSDPLRSWQEGAEQGQRESRSLLPTRPPTPTPTQPPPMATPAPTLPAGPMRQACNYSLSDQVHAKWTQLGSESGALGCPIADETEASVSPQGTAGRYAEFRGGGGASILWHRSGRYAGKTFVVDSCFFTLYKNLGRSASRLGFPTGDPYEAAGGSRQDFEGGYIRRVANTSICSEFYAR